jgi:pyrimidine operon attenuation protein/uracil phosphoribosyltransferase
MVSPEQLSLKMERMSLEVAARLQGADSSELLVLGVQGQGWLVAQQMALLLAPHLQVPVRPGLLEMDKKQPLTAQLTVDVADTTAVLLCDDVSNSGQTLLYALRPLLNQKLARLHCLVLVERMHNLFPVRADFYGLQLATAPTDYIEVEAVDGVFTGAWLRS